MNRLALLIAIALMFGCAAPQSESEGPRIDPVARQKYLEQMSAEYEATIPVCDGDADCRVKWETAQVWVARNAAYKIQTATAVLIETYSPSDASTGLAFKVIKEPLGGGVYRIIASAGCGVPDWCKPEPFVALIDFNHTVSSIVP